MAFNKTIVASVALVGLLVSFQNCQRARMASKGTEADNASLAQGTEVDLGLPDTPPGPTPNPNPNPNPNPPPICQHDNGDNDSDSNSDDDSQDHSKHAHHKSSDGHQMCDDDSSDDSSEDDCVDHNGQEDGNREYICGVGGPGNSTRLEITDNELQPKQQGVKMLCMSKHACEVIAARAFPGARAEKRGYCQVDSNKNVKHISDEHLIPLVDKYLKR